MYWYCKQCASIVSSVFCCCMWCAFSTTTANSDVLIIMFAAGGMVTLEAGSQCIPVSFAIKENTTTLVGR